MTIREGEDTHERWRGGICSAVLKELLRIVKDQIEERSVAVIVLNKESAIWKDAGMKTLSRDAQLKYIDIEGMRVAGQIKSDSVENVVTGESKVGESAKIGEGQHVESIVMNGVLIGKVEKV